MNIELYIGDRLCDIGNPEDLGIYLKRVFIKPSELSVKDAQKSYEISLPATPVNNEIFNYTNVEEVQGKFKVYDKARLYINGILILDGKFRMSQITRDAYIGNLGVPAAKTVKDIFGETMMNQAGKWLIPFKGVQDITTYNTGGHEKDKYGEISPCIFPLVLYGLLPKNKILEKYPDRESFDKNVVLNMDDLPPSVNCLHMLKRIFANANYKLTGTAMNDERLKNLYVSYKNPDEYEMPWSVPKMGIKGSWYNYSIEKGHVENKEFRPSRDGLSAFAVNLFNCARTSIEEKTDEEDNIEITEETTTYDRNININFKVPRSGLYKIELDATITMGNGSLEHYSGFNIDKGKFDKKFELKLVRNYTTTDYNNDWFDNNFFKDNIEQVRGGQNPEKFIFPIGDNVNFIDPKQNKNFICGFSWGNDTRNQLLDYYNPYSTANIRANSMAISGGLSWTYYDEEIKVIDRAYSAVKSPGYRNSLGEMTDFFKVQINNIDYPNVRYIPENSENNPTDKADGHISQIVWLNSGDILSLVTIASIDVASNKTFWHHHSIDFNLNVKPFQQSWQWLTIDDSGSSDISKPVMDWNDTATLPEKEINLIKFLPTETKVNDWIDNFCKAFNLEIINLDDSNFELNVKANKIERSIANIIDLDERANSRLGKNESLKLPATYELGFTVNTNETGYYDSITDYVIDEHGKQTNEKVITAGNSGGGKYYTGSSETAVVNQTSNFSYNWFKKIKNTENNTDLILPVVTEKEIWERGSDYSEMEKKRYTNLSQRFWFRSDTFTTNTYKGKKQVSLATVKEKYEGTKNLILDYKDEPDSILQNYFLLMVNNNNDYVVVDCFLTPEEYSRLSSSFVKFNGDIYYAAEIDGYDLLSKKQASLKLIRKII